MFTMPGTSHQGPLPDLTPDQASLRDDLGADLVRLAVDIGERNVQRHDALAEAASFGAAELEAAGCDVERQSYRVGPVEVENVIGEVAGGAAADEVVVVGAHYDTVLRCPGANDNGTGVVATLALARALAGSRPRRTLRFVLFVNEEPPYFRTEAMGSRVYARRCRDRGEDVRAMLSLETIGYYSDVKGSQRYPFPVGLFYPSAANFVAFVGNLKSRRLVRRSVGAFRRRAAFPSVGAALPGWITGVGWSDQWAFWKSGYPALMVTDTALYRYGAYHTPHDTIEKVDMASLARVVDGLQAVVADLAGTAGKGE
jgi:Zn-dependent M28 family amino/carboxypeptidase